MAEPHPLFDLSGSYIEIDGWVIIDLNPETRSIHEYQDYELSAESFLAELEAMQMLPSMRMPIPSMLSRLEVENEVTTSDRGGKRQRKSGANSAGKDEQHEEEQTDHSEERKAARKKRERVWAEITKNLKAALEAGGDDDTVAKDQDDTDDESDRPVVEDSPHRAGSESPETDLDFVQSSSENVDTEWMLGSGEVGLKVSDSLFAVESRGVKSVSGDVSGEDGEALDTRKAIKKLEGSEESFSKRVEAVENIGEESKDSR